MMEAIADDALAFRALRDAPPRGRDARGVTDAGLGCRASHGRVSGLDACSAGDIFIDRSGEAG
jgi:hypothetical protein